MLVFYILLSLVVSFLCSLLESVILSVTPSYLGSLKSLNPNLFKKVEHLKNDIEKPLASILTLNTVAHTIGAAGAGAQAQKLWGDEVLTVFSVVLTLLILFFSEIIPKSIGANYWKGLLSFSASILRPMIVLTFPLVWISNVLSSLFKDSHAPTVSRDEFMAMADIGLNEGVIRPKEHKALKSLIRFNKIHVNDVITPLNKVAGIDYQLTISQAFEELEKSNYSRLIIFGVNKDDIKGYVLRSKLQSTYIDKSEEFLKRIIKPVLICPDSTPLPEIMNHLLERREHICCIINDDGQFQGIVSLEDLIEKLLGLEIFDELDS